MKPGFCSITGLPRIILDATCSGFAIGGEKAAIEDWQIERDGSERGIVEITEE